jgi:murein DD-endopeptidase MepM/ murein hydrolase activator NlpD
MEVDIVNIKKFFPEKKNIRKSMLDFIDKKGFYIVLVLCIGIVGATALYVTTHNVSSPNTNYDAQKIVPDEMNNPASSISDKNAAQAPSVGTLSSSDKKAPASSPTTIPKPTAKADDKKQTAPKEEPKSTPKTNKSSKSVSTSVNKEQDFIMPVFGQVSHEFAKDKLVYSRTLESWETHDGIDLACEKGTTVKAVADGYVSEIKNDPRLGHTIIIDHQNGLKTVYSNLSNSSVVSPNQKVSIGDIIGCVGDTATFESAEQSHLHFEVLKDNEPVDPSNYLPKN